MIPFWTGKCARALHGWPSKVCPHAVANSPTLLPCMHIRWINRVKSDQNMVVENHLVSIHWRKRVLAFVKAIFQSENILDLIRFVLSFRMGCINSNCLNCAGQFQNRQTDDNLRPSPRHLWSGHKGLESVSLFVFGHAAKREYSTGPFTISEPQGQEMGEFYVVRNVVRQILKLQNRERAGRVSRCKNFAPVQSFKPFRSVSPEKILTKIKHFKVYLWVFIR